MESIQPNNKIQSQDGQLQDGQSQETDKRKKRLPSTIKSAISILRASGIEASVAPMWGSKIEWVITLPNSKPNSK